MAGSSGGGEGYSVRVWGVRVGVELVGEQTAFNKKNSNERGLTLRQPLRIVKPLKDPSFSIFHSWAPHAAEKW